jgi:putative Mg2+ transporter-C (MgtC) family protein
MVVSLVTGYELQFVFNMLLAVLAGFLIGTERESRGKDAGVSTYTFVILGSMLFTFLSSVIDTESKTRIAAQIITGIGFLGAGLIIKGDGGHVKNLTTAASLWLAAAIGMAIGFHYYIIAIIVTAACLLVPRLPHIYRKSPEGMDNEKKPQKE